MATSSSGSSAEQPSPAVSAVSTEASIVPPPDTALDKTPDDRSKIATFLSILKKFIGVADIANVRFSLPSNLLEPTPNLEYWNYMDRPETFVAMGDSDDATERMLAVLKFWFTKDLKFIKGKPVKPYNSTLGEFFRCNWIISTDGTPVGPPGLEENKKQEHQATIEQSAAKPIRVSYITEQTSHHPPVSAFYVDCPEKGITARGYDQIAAKFTGTGVRITPGAHNLGIFVTLQKHNNEEYQLTHPAAHVGGLLKGALSITVADLCYITCPKSKLKVILHYMAEGWLGPSKNKVEGVLFRYNPDNDKVTKPKDVPADDVLGRIEGNWQDKVYYTPSKTPSEKTLLIDLLPLYPAAKEVPPESEQLPNESRRFWAGVTTAILARDYNKANDEKQALEQRQRERAEERKASGETWQPRFFTGATTPVGKPELTTDGREALKGLHEGRFALEESKVLGAL